MSVAMAKMAAEDGITHLVATPHCNYEFPFDVEVNQAKIAELQSAVGRQVLDLGPHPKRQLGDHLGVIIPW